MKDKPQRILRYERKLGPNTTNANCINACDESGFNLAGTQYANECWCDNEFQFSPTKKEISECSASCTGNSAEKCGGTWMLTAFKKDVIETKVLGNDPVPKEKTSTPITSVSGWSAIGKNTYFFILFNTLC